MRQKEGVTTLAAAQETNLANTSDDAENTDSTQATLTPEGVPAMILAQHAI